MGKKILVICTGNSCRSQMAEGFLKSFDSTLEVYSAGTHPAPGVNPNALKVMKELGIDISHHFPKKVDKYIGEEWDYVITVCGGANESCPAFTGKVKKRLHIGFDDPAEAMGDMEEVLAEYRRVRDEIGKEFLALYQKIK
jgi:arsenate reductase